MISQPREVHPAPAGGGSSLRPALLLLVHRIPFPPDKGDKIRSYHLMRHLAARYRLFLGAFVDDPADLKHEEALRSLCAGVRLFRILPSWRKIASLTALAGGGSQSVEYYRDRRVSAWVDELRTTENLSAVVTFSSTMSQFVQGPKWSTIRRIADFVDVDSEKWRQYASSSRPPMSWLFARESRQLLAFERRIAANFDRTLFASAAEAELFVGRAPEVAGRVGYFSNGVDTDYFDPAVELPDPYPKGGPIVVFTGAMDYRPNIEAVLWFAREILPLVHARRPDVRFWIVGSNPSRAVRELAGRPSITVTGRVADTRPYLAHSSVAIAPLRIARGIQNKVLEALAMGRPVVCTSAAADGIESRDELRLSTEDDAGRFAQAVLRTIEYPRSGNARRVILERFGWSSHLRRIESLIEPVPAPERATPSAGVVC